MLPFPPFDRFSHLAKNSEQNLKEKFSEFKRLREQNITKLKEWVDPDKHLDITSIHPILIYPQHNTLHDSILNIVQHFR